MEERVCLFTLFFNKWDGAQDVTAENSVENDSYICTFTFYYIFEIISSVKKKTNVFHRK